MNELNCYFMLNDAEDKRWPCLAGAGASAGFPIPVTVRFIANVTSQARNPFSRRSDPATRRVKTTP